LSEAAEISETTEIGEPGEVVDEVEETSAPSPVVRKKLPGGALGALAGLALLGLGVLLLLGARGASLAGTLVTSAVVGGAAGFLASRNVRS
jgi:hypothetical protein